MRALLALAIARCAAARAPVVLDDRVASCGGERVALPASMAILRNDARAVIAADANAAIAIARDDAAAGGAWLIDETSDAGLIDQYATRSAHGCTFSAVARAPLTSEGAAIAAAIAGPRAGRWLIGSPRVPRRPPIDRLCEQAVVSCSSASRP